MIGRQTPDADLVAVVSNKSDKGLSNKLALDGVYTKEKVNAVRYY